jgi:hypothetical protein
VLPTVLPVKLAVKLNVPFVTGGGLDDVPVAAKISTVLPTTLTGVGETVMPAKPVGGVTVTDALKPVAYVTVTFRLVVSELYMRAVVFGIDSVNGGAMPIDWALTVVL